jgi:hypothetical protein
MVPALEPGNPLIGAMLFIQNLGTLLLPFQTNGLIPRWDGAPPFGLGVLLGAAFLRFAWLQLQAAPLQRVLFFGMVAYCFVFAIAVYALPLRHVMLIALLLVMLAWLRGLRGETLSTGMRLWLLTGSLCGLTVAAINLTFPFDRSERAGQEIATRGLQDQVWMAFPDAEGLGVGIHARTGMRFLRPQRHCVQGYVHWNYRQPFKKAKQFFAHLDQESQKIGGFYLITSLDLEDSPPGLLQPIALVRSGYDGRNYYLFRVRPELPASTARFPPCAAGR